MNPQAMKLLIEQGDYNGAAGYCNDILKVYPDCVDIHFWRIVALYKQGYIDSVTFVFAYQGIVEEDSAEHQSPF